MRRKLPTWFSDRKDFVLLINVLRRFHVRSRAFCRSSIGTGMAFARAKTCPLPVITTCLFHTFGVTVSLNALLVAVTKIVCCRTDKGR